MEERRVHVRAHIEVPVHISLNGERLPAEIKNLSLGGVLIVLEEKYSSALSNELAGQKILFHPDKDAPDKNINATIIRVFTKHNLPVIALEIEKDPEWKKFCFNLIRSL